MYLNLLELFIRTINYYLSYFQILKQQRLSKTNTFYAK